MNHVFCLQGTFHLSIYLISNHYPVKGGKSGYSPILHMKKKNAVSAC